MASVNEIRLGLAANLAAISGVQNTGYLLNNPTPPTLMIMPGPPGGGDFTEYHQAMGNGLETMTWTVRAEVAVNLDIGSQQKLDAMLDVDGESSVMRAIEADKTLGGLVSDLLVTRSVAGMVPTRDGVAEKIAAEWEVTVYT